jgi:hypothetical protein
MAYRITAVEVRNRLRTIVAAEAADVLLASAPFIPTSEAWLNLVLTKNSKSYSTATADEQALLKAAQIAYCAYKVLIAMPQESYKAGLTQFGGTDANALKTILDALRKEWTELLALCGIQTATMGGATSGGDDYQPDLSDETNIHLSDTSGYELSRFA